MLDRSNLLLSQVGFESLRYMFSMFRLHILNTGIVHEKRTSADLGKLIAAVHSAADQSSLNEWEKVKKQEKERVNAKEYKRTHRKENGGRRCKGDRERKGIENERKEREKKHTVKRKEQ